MKFQDIPADILTIRVKQTDAASKKLVEQPIFSVESSPTRLNEFEIRLKDTVIFVKPVSNADIRRLNNELASGHAILSQLANPAADGSIELQVAFFSGECIEMGNIEIGVDEYVENAIGKIERRKFTGLYKHLEKMFCFSRGDEAFFFLLAGPSIVSTIKPEHEEQIEEELEEENEDSDSEILQSSPETAAPKPEPTLKNSFCVSGDGIRFIATETRIPNGKSIYITTRLTRSKKEPDRALRLAKGKLKFVDWTRTGQIQILAKEQLNNITKEDSSYLKKWDEFGDLEGEILLKHAREISALQYSHVTQLKGKVEVHVSQISESALASLKVGGVEEIEVVDELPDYLKNLELKFSDFVSGIERDVEAKELIRKERKKQEEKSYFKVSDFDVDSKTLTIETENLPPQGMLILSLAGEIAQIKRRMSARRAILEGRSANPQLGLLIEENGVIAPIRQPHKIEPLTAFVRDKVFNNPPTEIQKEAIERALNTPDIALIQGPPGTGKTTVIAAILERLNEMADKRGKNFKGQVLLTGFQHDAVENMIERLSINGMPVPKFGNRSGADEDSFSVFEKELEEWCAKISADIREKNPQINEVEKEREIKNLCLQYIKVPTRTLAANLAKKITALGVSVLGEDTARYAANIAKKLSLEENLTHESNPLLDAVRRLRIRAESFADDGPDRAADALDDLGNTIEDNECDLLEKASLWYDTTVPPFLHDLEELKKKLLIRFTAPPIFRVEKQSDEIIELAQKAITKIQANGISAKDKKSTALAEFLAEMESNSYGMIDAVSDYSFAFAATCQQSVNSEMQRQKGISRDNIDQKMVYEYVIVDEAARVSPRDLMIPMAQGKRIILVGDHRQLPHIIDDEIARQMEEGEESAKESEWLKKSMFEYLFSERLKTLKEKDGFERYVTLDKQYRMHPLLGDFISRNFYERFAPSEKFDSGRPGSDFMHNLPETFNKPAIWLNVPEGGQQKTGTSWTRPAEATAIVRQLQTWIESKEGKPLSFGVISFYKAQSELIKGQLKKISTDDKKLRIGTVDSFQGMEFDVVFLSMVRKIPPNWKPSDKSRELQARNLFGHLCLYNRLNVSMSRQKKLLVVVGDAGLLQNDLARDFIPGLVDFYKLCQDNETGRVLQCL
jgi:nucleoside-triphosphatase THEP1